MNLDREKLVQENIKLKTQLNKLEAEKINHKREITNLEMEINKRNIVILIPKMSAIYAISKKAKTILKKI